MVKQLGIICVVALCALGTMTAAAGDDEALNKIQKQLSDGWKKHKSVTANMKMTMNREMPGGSATMNGKGTLEHMRKGDKNLQRLELEMTMTQKMGENTQEMKQATSTISDGEFTYTLMEMMGQKMATKSKVDNSNAVDPDGMFDNLRKDFNLKLLPEETVNGAKVVVIQATPKQEGAMPMTKMVNYIDLKHGMMVKTVVYGADDKPMQTTEFTDFKFDVDIDPERFVFKAPEGVQVMDNTQVP